MLQFSIHASKKDPVNRITDNRILTIVFLFNSLIDLQKKIVIDIFNFMHILMKQILQYEIFYLAKKAVHYHQIQILNERKLTAKSL